MVFGLYGSETRHGGDQLFLVFPVALEEARREGPLMRMVIQ